MKVSIIIPTYSPGEYIYECLDSIVSQTLPAIDFETIIILNGPKEPFYTQLEEYIAKNATNNFKLINTDVPGVSNARNIGLDNANGEYITFVDDDDIISPEYLKELLYASSPTCVGISNVYAFTEGLDSKYEYGLTRLYRECKVAEFSFNKFRKFLSPPFLKLIHRSIIGNTRFYTGLKISEDSLFCFEISKNIKAMKCAQETAIYYFRIRKGSATRKKMDKSYIYKLTIKKIWLFTKVYFSAPFRYNIPLYASRILASIKHAKKLYNDSKKYE